MSFANTPNKLTVNTIRSKGVKSIRFDAANFLESLDISTDSLIGHLFGASTNENEYEHAEMIAQLNIRPRTIKNTKLELESITKNEWLEKAAIKTHLNKFR